MIPGIDRTAVPERPLQVSICRNGNCNRRMAAGAVTREETSNAYLSRTSYLNAALMSILVTVGLHIRNGLKSLLGRTGIRRMD